MLYYLEKRTKALPATRVYRAKIADLIFSSTREGKDILLACFHLTYRSSFLLSVLKFQRSDERSADQSRSVKFTRVLVFLVLLCVCVCGHNVHA